MWPDLSSSSDDDAAVAAAPDDAAVAAPADDAVAAPADDADHVAVAVHHRRGADHSEISKMRMQLGKAKGMIKSLKREAADIICNGISAFAKHVSQVCFSRKQPLDSRIVMLAGGGTTNVALTKHGKRTYDANLCLQYGLLSAVHGQASGLASMIRSNQSSNLQHLIAMNEFDDAGMWVQDPATEAQRASGERVEGARLKSGRLWTRGKNIFLPVCNQCEHLFARKVHSNGVQTFIGADVHSPAKPLCKANAGTIADRWSNWAACCFWKWQLDRSRWPAQR